MIGSDNVCYVIENEGLSAFDSGITFPKLQAVGAGESADLSSAERICAVCPNPLTGRQKRCCSARCSANYATHFFRGRDTRGEKNGNWKGGLAQHPILYTKPWKARNPEKVAAQRAVQGLIRAGHLTRPTSCASCGRDGRVDAHHPDYSRPLSIEWLCRKCHVAADRIRQRLQRDVVPHAGHPRGDEQLAQAVYLTSAEAVRYLGLSSMNALKQRMKRGTIPAWCWTRMGSKSLRFVRASLDEWLQPKDRAAALRLVHRGQSVAELNGRQR